MKYQYILNDVILFETNDVTIFFSYLLTEPKAEQAKNSILYNLLEKSGGYTCNMATH